MIFKCPPTDVQTEKKNPTKEKLGKNKKKKGICEQNKPNCPSVPRYKAHSQHGHEAEQDAL